MLMNIYSILCCASDILGKGVVIYPTKHLTAAVRMYCIYDMSSQNSICIL